MSRTFRRRSCPKRRLEKCFREKYLSQKYYDNMAEQFYEHKFGQFIDDEYKTGFFELWRYVPYIKVRIQRFKYTSVDFHKHLGTK